MIFPKNIDNFADMGAGVLALVSVAMGVEIAFSDKELPEPTGTRQQVEQFTVRLSYLGQILSNAVAAYKAAVRRAEEAKNNPEVKPKLNTLVLPLRLTKNHSEFAELLMAFIVNKYAQKHNSGKFVRHQFKQHGQLSETTIRRVWDRLKLDYQSNRGLYEMFSFMCSLAKTFDTTLLEGCMNEGYFVSGAQLVDSLMPHVNIDVWKKDKRSNQFFKKNVDREVKVLNPSSIRWLTATEKNSLTKATVTREVTNLTKQFHSLPIAKRDYPGFETRIQALKNQYSATYYKIRSTAKLRADLLTGIRKAERAIGVNPKVKDSLVHKGDVITDCAQVCKDRNMVKEGKNLQTYCDLIESEITHYVAGCPAPTGQTSSDE